MAMGTFTAVLVVPDEMAQEWVQQRLEQIGAVAFFGPGSLAEGVSEAPDDETACANCGVPMFVPTSQAQGEVRCADCSPSEFGAEVSVPRDGGVVQLEFGGFRVGVRLEMTDDGPLLSLKAINCGLEGEMPGEYYLTGRGDGV